MVCEGPRHLSQVSSQSQRHLPEPAKGRIALHCVGLSEERKAIVEAKTQGNLDDNDISQALRPCFPQYRAAGTGSKKAMDALQVDQLHSAADPEDEPEHTFDDAEAWLKRTSPRM